MSLSEDEIRDRLSEAAYVIARLPGPRKPKGPRVSWPDIPPDWTSYGSNATRVVRPVFEPAQIDRAHEAAGWLSCLAPDTDLIRLVWAHSAGASFPSLAERRQWKFERSRHLKKYKPASLQNYHAKAIFKIHRNLVESGENFLVNRLRIGHYML